MLSAVITEASLLYRWGLREDRREQIEHLVTISIRRNVQLHIQRFEDGPPTGMHSMLNDVLRTHRQKCSSPYV